MSNAQIPHKSSSPLTMWLQHQEIKLFYRENHSFSSHLVRRNNVSISALGVGLFKPGNLQTGGVDDCKASCRRVKTDPLANIELSCRVLGYRFRNRRPGIEVQYEYPSRLIRIQLK